MQCPHCNWNNPANAAQCTNCGAVLASGLPIGKVMHGRYRILLPLSKGGMGALYLANETIATRPRKVVVKELIEYYNPQDPNSQARARQRFEAEAETLASLNVAGIPQIFDFFTEDGHHCIVMQYIEGEDLENGLSQLGHPYAIEQVRRWGLRLCKILESLAVQNVLHLDIKPANLVVDRHGEVWLVDFGTSKAQYFSTPAKFAGSAKKSSVYGTIGYAAPEQIAGKPESGSDVYALAATLYHLMSGDDPGDHPGKFPFIGRFPQDIARALQLALNPDVKQRITASGFGRQLEVQTGQIPSFRWQDGTIAHQPRDLVLTADRKWEEARKYFTSDAWSNWFQSIHYNDLPVTIQAIQSQQPNPDLALDAFLRHLDANYPAPRLEVSPADLNLGALPWKTHQEFILQVTNRGSGCLKGFFSHVPLGLQVDPAQFTVHDQIQVKVRVNTGLLSPATRSQTLHLEIEAGQAGQVQIPIRLSVPEPAMHIDQPAVDLGSTYLGQVFVHRLQISNQGLSPFQGEVRSDATWIKAQPERFICRPGSQATVELEVNTQGLPVQATHLGRVSISGKAGSWQKVSHVPVTLQVSLPKTILKYVGPPLGWSGAAGIYGACFGALLGSLLGSLLGPLHHIALGLFTGAILGAIIYLLIGVTIGALGGIPAARRIDGVRRGVKYSLIAGSLGGGLAGYLAYRLLVWLGLALYAGQGWGWFGAVTGALAGLLLGFVLWLVAR
ncbi:MAG: serine/threonine-protein kinase [Chloroflexota bacterium]